MAGIRGGVRGIWIIERCAAHMSELSIEQRDSLGQSQLFMHADAWPHDSIQIAKGVSHDAALQSPHEASPGYQIVSITLQVRDPGRPGQGARRLRRRDGGGTEDRPRSGGSRRRDPRVLQRQLRPRRCGRETPISLAESGRRALTVMLFASP